MNVSEYRTSDLYLASILRSIGFKFLFIETDKERNRKVFVFEENDNMKYTPNEIVEMYFNNELGGNVVNIKDVVDNIKFFKLKIYE